MTTKKTTGKVTVTKHVEATIKRLGTRSRKDFQEELQRHIDSGFVVDHFVKRYDGVHVFMKRQDEWTIDELMSEIDEQLASEVE